MNRLSWLFKMAYRDSRRSRSRLLLFLSSIVLGIAALVAIGSFGDNLKEDIEKETKGLLGADLVVRTNQEPGDTLRMWLDSLKGDEMASEIEFNNMVLFPGNGTKLMEVRGISGGFPFYGDFETKPADAAASFGNGAFAIVDEAAMTEMDLEPGDSVRVGEYWFTIAGGLVDIPGSSSFTRGFTPPLIIPGQYVDSTGLIAAGSRAQYKFYLRYNDDALPDQLVEKYDKRMALDDIRTTTVEERKERLRRNFDQLTGFLNLVAFIALLLGCIGVASTVHVYVRSKIANVAILRCLGAKGSDAFYIYLIQIGSMGLIGSVIGAALGSVLQYAIPGIFQGMLTVDVSTGISALAIVQGILTGFFISILFALLPLLAIRNISPLVTLRADYEQNSPKRDWLRWFVGLAVILFVLLFAFIQTGEWLEAGLFTLFICFAYLVLFGAGKLLMWMVRKFLPSSWPYVYRQGVANLYRPGNQTIVLLISIGLGTGMLASMVFVQHMLLGELQLAGGADKANLILYDIQQSQREEVAEILDSAGLPLLSEVPVVTTRISGINGRSRQELLSDTTDEYNDRSLSWEYRITFREDLNPSEKITDGDWQGRVESPGDSVFISLDGEFAERLGVALGDKITWNIQGLPVETYVGSLRQIDWNEVDANFMVLFPSGVLEKAPHFSLMFTRVPADSVATGIQNAVVKEFANVTIINLGRVFDQVSKIVDKMAFVIRFMALFSILTGLVVLISSVLISRYQRIRESVLLRTIGASKKQIWLIQLFEYLFLGSLAVFTGIVLAAIASSLLAFFVFKITFSLPWLSLLIIFIAITGLAIIIGLFNSREVVSRPPLAVLRKEI